MFLTQNALLREVLASLKPSGKVNPPVFEALDRFDDELHGNTHTDALRETVTSVFSDFTALRVRETRELFVGGQTGHFGTDWVQPYGYINFLSDCDSAFQWTLFMPDLVQQQQKGFRMVSFEYKKLPAMRFIGKEKDFSRDPEGLEELFRTLDLLSEYRSGFDWDILLFTTEQMALTSNPSICFGGGLWQQILRYQKGLKLLNLRLRTTASPDSPIYPSSRMRFFPETRMPCTSERVLTPTLCTM